MYNNGVYSFVLLSLFQSIYSSVNPLQILLSQYYLYKMYCFVIQLLKFQSQNFDGIYIQFRLVCNDASSHHRMLLMATNNSTDWCL